VGVDAWFAAFEYEGVARELVARVKYRRAHAATAWLAEAMIGLVPVPVPVSTVVTWAPTTVRHRRERGFDHAALLARHVGRGLGVPVRALLTRAGGRPQTGLSASERRMGPRYEARRVVDADVVLVDDVATTGATLAAAASALRAAGAGRIVAVTAARVSAEFGAEPPRGPARRPS
jgi:predicted amidophosphoribosyltransferase